VWWMYVPTGCAFGKRLSSVVACGVWFPLDRRVIQGTLLSRRGLSDASYLSWISIARLLEAYRPTLLLFPLDAFPEDFGFRFVAEVAPFLTLCSWLAITSSYHFFDLIRAVLVLLCLLRTLTSSPQASLQDKGVKGELSSTYLLKKSQSGVE